MSSADDKDSESSAAPKLSFGLMIRCRRLRWHPVTFGGKKYCIRFSDIQQDPWLSLVEVCPIDPKQIKDGRGKRLFRVFDSDKELAECIESSPALRSIKKAKKYFTLTINDSGEIATRCEP